MNKLRIRTGNTLVELIIYIALTIVITVGLANVIARIRTAQFTTDIKSEVQQTVRTTVTQLTALGKTYDQAYCPPTGDCSESTEVYLWNKSENPNVTTGMPTTYLKVWFDSAERGALIAQHFADGAPSSSELQLTPTTVTVSEFNVTAIEEQSKTPNLSMQIVIRDSTSQSSAAPRDSLSIMTSIPLRPQNVPLSNICCPQYLSASCPADVPRCADGCFADNQAMSMQVQNILNPQSIALDAIRHRLFVSSIEGQVSKVIVLELDEQNKFKTQGQRFELGAPAGDNDQKLRQARGLSYDSVHDRLFVADTNNNRIMVYDTKFITNNENAVAVLGQQGFQSVNSAGAGSNGLSAPSGVTYDFANDHLYVADTGNNRALRFDVKMITNGEDATMAFGTASPQDGNTAPGTSASKLRNPSGVALDLASQLLFVSDTGNNRVVTFKLTDAPPHSADDVFGQAALTTSTAGTSVAALNAPNGIAYDTLSHRLFVADEQNHRIAVFGNANTVPTAITTARTIDSVLGQADKNSATPSGSQQGLSGPRSIAFDRASQLLFVADTANNRILSYQGGSSPTCGGGPDLTLIKPVAPPMSAAPTSSAASETLSCPVTNADGPLFANINDNMNGSPPDNQDYIQACGANDAVYFTLNDVPSNFGTAKTAKYRVVRRVNAGTPGRFSAFSVELYQSDKTSKLATGPTYSMIGPGQVDIPPNPTWVTEEFTVNQNGITGQNDKAGWNDALLKIETLDPTSYVQISAAEVEVEYFVQGSTTTTATTILHVNGDAGGKLTSPPIAASSSSEETSSSSSSIPMTMTVWKRVGTLTSPNLVANWPMEKSSDINVVAETHGYNGTLPSDSNVQTSYQSMRTVGGDPDFPWAPAVNPFQWQKGNWMLDLSLGQLPLSLSYFTVPDNAGYRFTINAPFTISYVERYFGHFGAVQFAPILRKMSDAPVQGFNFTHIKGAGSTYLYCFEIATQPGNRSVAYATDVQQIVAGTFNHIVLTFDPARSVANRVKIYINGIESETMMGLNCSSTTPVVAGQEYGETSITTGVPLVIGAFSGYLDDLRIYNKVMEPWEID